MINTGENSEFGEVFKLMQGEEVSSCSVVFLFLTDRVLPRRSSILLCCAFHTGCEVFHTALCTALGEKFRNYSSWMHVKVLVLNAGLPECTR